MSFDLKEGITQCYKNWFAIDNELAIDLQLTMDLQLILM